jgi:hypothetical protein
MLILSSYAYCDCPFFDNFEVRTTGGNSAIKVLSIIPQSGSDKVEVGEYNPNYIGSFLVGSSFEISGRDCCNYSYGDYHYVENYSAIIEVKIGYDDENYCTIEVDDGTLRIPSITLKNCVGNVEYSSYDNSQATYSSSNVMRANTYYVYFNSK